jgi:uncharacterized protein YbbC (DUF1343 family)
MRTGLEVLLESAESLKGQSVGVCCNHTAVTRDLEHIIGALQERDIAIRRVFGPEHGVDATAQDMISVKDEEDHLAMESVSLYGSDEASLHPAPETLSDLDVLLFDIQDIGSRYYTYQATLGYIMEVAAQTGTRVHVLDRPNPIDGMAVEGNVVEPGFESFVSAYPLANRHGMTMGELGRFFQRQLGIDCELEVTPCEGWKREQWLDETGLPWVYPSPNMPMLETAAIYPGMCFIEGTNLSEGRGCTRPFHLVGAPWIDRRRFVDLCRKGALDAGLEGVAFREATFEPRFQKHAGEVCHGVEIFVTDRWALHATLLGLVVLEAGLRENPERFKWRTETYEFVDEPIAIDLLCGSAEARVGLEARVRPRDMIEAWREPLADFSELREAHLLY